MKRINPLEQPLYKAPDGPVDLSDSAKQAKYIGDGLFAIAEVLRYTLLRIGVGSASTDMGGLESISKELKEGLEILASAVSNRG